MLHRHASELRLTLVKCIALAVENDVSDDDVDRDESNVTSTSDHMTMNFMMGKTPVTLELEHNENIPQLSSYFTSENGKLIRWTLDEEQVKHLSD